MLHAPIRPVLNAMSVDVEDWFQVGAFEKVIDRADWDGFAPRVGDNTARVLDLFAEAGVHGTFFTLGWVAERFPALMRRIVEEGHELASHGYGHARVHGFTPDQFRADIARARKVLEDAGGAAITAYRAPNFSIDARTPWAHPILAEEGYAYSSSVAPLAHDHYGWASAPRHAYRPLPDSPLIELPMTVMRFAGRELTSGGGFFRLLPNAVMDRAVRAANAAGRPMLFYFHPWEVDPGQPRVARAPLRSKLRHYPRLGAMAGKLQRLLAAHPWGRTDAVVAQAATALA